MSIIREIQAKEIEETVYKLFLNANVILPSDVYSAIKSAEKTEKTEFGKSILKKLDENAEYAAKSKLPICQDTGMAIVFIELGQDVHIDGENLNDSVNNGVRRAYKDGFFRKSVVSHPLERKNSGDNTPAVIHTEIVSGDKIKITAAPKGFGSENMSSLRMFNPSIDIKEIIEFVTETVEKAGGNPCPPIIVGVGIGGSFEYSAYLSKKALLREVGVYNEDEKFKALEIELLDNINKTGVGVQGLGGNNTALWVAVEGFATHIAGLPVAVNISCHVTRHASMII